MRRYISKDLAIVARKRQICLGKLLENYNLSIAEHPFFMRIAENEGATQEKFTSMVGLDKAVTTRAMKSMEEKKLIYREKDTIDRRKVHIYLTDKGRELYPIVKNLSQKLNAKMVTNISNDDLITTHKSLQLMIKNLDSFEI